MTTITNESVNKYMPKSSTQAPPVKVDPNVVTSDTGTQKVDSAVLNATTANIASANTSGKNVNPLSQKELLSNMNDVNQQLKASGSHLHFKVDKTTGVEVMQIFDDKTKKVIQQFPSETFLKISAQIQDFLNGSAPDGSQNTDKAPKGVLVNHMV